MTHTSLNDVLLVTVYLLDFLEFSWPMLLCLSKSILIGNGGEIYKKIYKTGE